MTIYKRYCNTCGKYYEGYGSKYCSYECALPYIGRKFKTLSDGSWYPKIPDLCHCRCREIVWDGREFIKGHQNIRRNLPSHVCYYDYTKVSLEKRLERALKISLKKKGIKFSEKHCKNISLSKIGKPTWNKGLKLSKEFCDAIKDGHADFSGENHPNWQGGKSFEPYCYKFNNDLKEQVRLRDHHVCQLCGRIKLITDIRHAVHHVHYDKTNCFPDLITLCRQCNLKVNFNRFYWEQLFMNKLNDRELLFWTKRYVR